MADQRMRSERMEKLRRVMETDIAEGRAPAAAGGFDAARPWDAVFLAAANDSEFWNEEVRETALLFISRVKDREEISDPGHHVHVHGEWRAGAHRSDGHDEDRAGGKSKARRDREKKKLQGVKEQQQWEKKLPAKGEDKGKGKGDKGKKGKGKGRVQVCFAWNRDDGGCPTPCPNARAHVCEFCGASDHKGTVCKKAW